MGDRTRKIRQIHLKEYRIHRHYRYQGKYLAPSLEEDRGQFFFLMSEYRMMKCYLSYPLRLQNPPSLPVRLPIRPKSST